MVVRIQESGGKEILSFNSKIKSEKIDGGLDSLPRLEKLMIFALCRLVSLVILVWSLERDG